MKILIADDYALFRDGLRFNLEKILSDAALTDANSWTQAVELLKDNPDTNLALVSLDMPDSDWEKGVKSLKSVFKGRVGVLSDSEDAYTIKKAVSLGICCYLPKNIERKVLTSALELILDGGTYFPSALLKQTSENMSLKNGKRLTNRQFEVLKYLSQGLSNKQIAYHMAVSEATVKLHINALLRAVAATNRTQAVIKAQKLGVI